MNIHKRLSIPADVWFVVLHQWELLVISLLKGSRTKQCEIVVDIGFKWVQCVNRPIQYPQK